VTADAYSGLGRDSLLRVIELLEAKVESLEKQVREREATIEGMQVPRSWQEVVRVALDEHEAMVETLTTAQAAGTEAQLGRQRARALLREVLDWGVVPESETIRERIRKELGS
jgi:hypothetical protein